mmetsp:Transcript_21260/g.64463  ORF Transcript_21260/g.64463 Transcript_21260/m.64463 type:complete len:90 (-) Transcript_21260:51-320(-)
MLEQGWTTSSLNAHLLGTRPKVRGGSLCPVWLWTPGTAVWRQGAPRRSSEDEAQLLAVRVSFKALGLRTFHGFAAVQLLRSPSTAPIGS